jgi:hypothetical protein
MVHTLKSNFTTNIVGLQSKRPCPGNDLFVKDAQFRLFRSSQAITFAVIRAHLKAQEQNTPLDMARIASLYNYKDRIVTSDPRTKVKIHHCTSPSIKFMLGSKEDDVVIKVLFTVDCIQEQAREVTQLWNQSIVFSVVHRVDVHDYRRPALLIPGRSLSTLSFLGDDICSASGWVSSTPSLSLTDRLSSGSISVIDTVAQNLADFSHLLASALSINTKEEDRSIESCEM